MSCTSSMIFCLFFLGEGEWELVIRFFFSTRQNGFKDSIVVDLYIVAAISSWLKQWSHNKDNDDESTYESTYDLIKYDLTCLFGLGSQPRL